VSDVTRVLVVDDSRIHRTALTNFLTRRADFEVIGTAADGIEAVEMTARLRPAVILMDVQMPRLSGLEATERIMSSCPTPILLMTAADNLAREVDLGMRALEYGALDLVPKPDFDALRGPGRSPLADRLRLLAGVPVISHLGARRPAVVPAPVSLKGTDFYRRAGRCVVIVASTGGPRALTTLLAALPADLRAAVVVVQHLDSAFEDGLVKWLDEHSPLEVSLAQHGAPLFEGRVFVAPQGVFAEVTSDRKVALVEDPDDRCAHRPSGDRLFRSAAQAYGRRTVGVVLTGMGEDGAKGLAEIRRSGGATFAQDEESSVIYGMPRAAFENGAAQRVLSLDKLPRGILEALA